MFDRRQIKLLNSPICVSVGYTKQQVILTVQLLSFASVTCTCSENGRTVSISMLFPDEPKLLKLATDALVVAGASEFFGPVKRDILLPENIAVDPYSKVMVYDRSDGIVTARFDREMVFDEIKR